MQRRDPLQAEEQKMNRRNRLTILTVIPGVLIFWAGAAAAPASDIPTPIKAPDGEKLVLKVHAAGVQIYSCTVAADQTVKWALKAPDAEPRECSPP